MLLQSQPETTSERTLALQRCFVLAEKLRDHSWEEYQAKTDGELQIGNVSALATSEKVFLVVQDVVLREIVPCEVFLVPQNHFANDTFSVALVMPE